MSWRRVGHAIWRLPRWTLMGVIRAYQVLISPLYGPTCKYYPSCSHYGYEALRRHGVVRGTALTAWRVARCNPWSHGGVDDVPGLGEPMFRRHPVTTPLAT